MNPEDLIQVGRDYYPKGMRPATNEETIAQLTADLAAAKAERDGYKAALLRTDATVIKYREKYDEDSQMLREISHDIDGTLMHFDPEFATPAAHPQVGKEAP